MGTPSFFRDSSWSVLARLWMAAARGIGLVLISRQLGPEDFGIYAIVLNTYVVLVMVGSLGLEQANTFFAGRFPQRTSVLFANALGSSLVLGAISIGLLMLVARACAGWLFDARSVALLHDAVWFLPLALLHNQMAGLIVGRGWFGWYAASEFVKWGIYLVLLGALAAMDVLRVRTALIAFYATIGMTTLLHAAVVRRRSRHDGGALLPDGHLLRETVSYGWQAFSVNIVNLLNFRFDLYLVKFFRSPAEVGWYSLGVNLAEVLLYFARSINLVLFSRISSNQTRSASLTPAVSRHAVALVLGFIAAMLVFKDPVILRIFGMEFASSANVVTLMLPGILAQTITLVLVADLLGSHALRPVLWSGLLCFGVMVALDLLWIPTFGVLGAAAAASIAYLAQSLMLLVTHARGTGQSTARYLLLARREMQNLVFLATRRQRRV